MVSNLCSDHQSWKNEHYLHSFRSFSNHNLSVLLIGMMIEFQLKTASSSSHCHGVWKSQKRSHSTLRATLQFKWTKILKNAQNSQFGSFLHTVVCGQTVLPNRSIVVRQQLVENIKIQMRRFQWFSYFCPITSGLFSNTVWLQASGFQKLAIIFNFFGIFNELLSTQNVNVARFARNVEWDFFYDFQIPLSVYLCLCFKS